MTTINIQDLVRTPPIDQYVAWLDQKIETLQEEHLRMQPNHHFCTAKQRIRFCLETYLQCRVEYMRQLEVKIERSSYDAVDRDAV